MRNGNAFAEERVRQIQMQKDDVARLVVDRDPCVRCGMPKHRHDQHGCATYWRVG